MPTTSEPGTSHLRTRTGAWPVAVGLACLLTCGLLVGCRPANGPAEQVDKRLTGVGLPIYPGAAQVSDRTGEWLRVIWFHAPVGYRTMDVLRFYKRELARQGTWVPETRFVLNQGHWFDAEVPEVRQSGRVGRPTGKSLGTAYYYWYMWRNTDSDLLLRLEVADYALVDDSWRRIHPGGTTPGQVVNLVLMEATRYKHEFGTAGKSLTGLIRSYP